MTFMLAAAAIRPIRGASVVTASCAAVASFTRALAIGLVPIRVNAIQPGIALGRLSSRSEVGGHNAPSGAG
jgi:NAD(P)-dependent dehydrogenase (short-subunit alcohol dehydrogenase family)